MAEETTTDSAQLPRELSAAEEDLIRQRRGLPALGDPLVTLGVALSGGGIRSATLSLGLLQSLARLGLLPHVDYVSSVSGGGYTASWLGALFQRWKRPAGSTREEDWARVQRALGDPHGHPIDWLRENGRFLAPNGAGDLALAAAVVLRNLCAIAAVLGTSFLGLFLAANGLRWALERAWQQLLEALSAAGVLAAPRDPAPFVSESMWWSPALLLVPALLLGWVVPAALAFWWVGSDPADEDGAPAQRRPGLIVAGVCAAALLVAGLAHTLPLSRTELAAAVVATVMLIAAAQWRHALRASAGHGARARNLLTLRLRTALVFTLTALAFALIDSAAQTLFLRFDAAELARWLGAALLALASLATALQRFSGLLGDRSGARPRLPATLLASAAALALGGSLLVITAAVGHALTWRQSSGAPWTPPATLRYQGTLGAQPLALSEPAPAGHARCDLNGAPRLCAPRSLHVETYCGALAIVLTSAWIFGRSRSFVNRSSLASLYGSRLARAYLGASNVEREKPTGKMLGVALDGDDLPLRDYQPHRQGGPLHIINVTLNETVGGRSQVELRDRKGMGMAIGPAGVSVGARHHALWTPDRPCLVPTRQPTHGFRVFPAGRTLAPSWPTLGRWVAISGAAVSTGLGWRTSVGLSVLLGLFNVRLGHWWQSDIDPEQRPEKVDTPSWLARRGKELAHWLPVQAHLGAELLARFPGTDSRDWYLTDGGHFETTGAYELIRRRVRLIIVCDHSADPECGLDELGNLVRKARTDFGAAIEFATEAAVTALSEPLQRAFGTLADLGFHAHALVTPQAAATGASPRRARRYASFARVTYADGSPPSLLVYLRPAVLGVEPVDVLAYHHRNAGFPQQSTGDQFFDEAQWESYRRLGEHMGDITLQPFAPTLASPERWREVMEELAASFAEQARSSV